MGYRLTLLHGYRARVNSALPHLFHPGVYYVPDNMPDHVATGALAAKVAVRDNEPVSEQIDAMVDEGEDDELDHSTSPPKRKRGRPRKTPAPENKAVLDAGNRS